jgi:membrane-associated phospholipid phosphatase
MVSRAVQWTIPTHLRPLFDTQLNFAPPDAGFAAELSHWNCFPSDHVAMYSGLAVALYVVDRKLCLVALALTAVHAVARMYLGLHFLSDVIGGFGLGALCVALMQLPGPLSRIEAAMALKVSRPALFYFLAFVGSYEAGVLFDDVRHIGSGVLKAVYPGVIT